MRSPLALLKVPYRGDFVWRVLFSLRGLGRKKAHSIVLLREPSDEEREALEALLTPGDRLVYLDALLVQSMLFPKEENTGPL